VRRVSRSAVVSSVRWNSCETAGHTDALIRSLALLGVEGHGAHTIHWNLKKSKRNLLADGGRVRLLLIALIMGPAPPICHAC
jgi:hypothetical protein